MLSASAFPVKQTTPRSPHRIRMTVSRGTTAAGSAPAPLPLKSNVNAGAPGAWSARPYTPDPDRSVPLKFTALPALTVGTSGYGWRKVAESCWYSDKKVRVRKCHDVSLSSAGVANPGRSDTQLESAQRVTVVSKLCPVWAPILLDPASVVWTNLAGKPTPY